MNIEAVHATAKPPSIKPDKLSITALTKTVQSDEGNFNCYGTALSCECDQVNCLWREDCLDISAA